MGNKKPTKTDDPSEKEDQKLKLNSRVDKEPIKKENIDFFYENLHTFLKDESLLYKYLVIHDKEVKKAFKEFPEALKYAAVNLPKNEYVIQQVIKKNETVNFIF